MSSPVRFIRFVVPDGRAEAFEHHLFLIHRRVGLLKNLMDAVILVGDILRHSAGNDRLVRPDMGGGPLVQLVHQYAPVFIIPSLQEHREFVATDPVHRAVGKDIADHPARPAYVFIPGFVAQGIVDLLEAVDIADDKGKIEKLAPAQLFVQRLLRFEIGLFALHARQSVPIGLAMHLRDLRFQLRLHGMYLSFQGVHGDGILSRILARGGRFPACGRIAHLLHERSRQIVQLAVDGPEPPLAARDDGDHDRPTEQEGEQRHDDRRPGKGGQLLVVPLRAEVHRDDAGHLAL